jgi:predicted alpha/beta hydrolase family esterase
LDRAAREAGKDIVIAAHSLGALLVAHWLGTTAASVRGVLLVAVPDPDGAHFPAQAQGFAPLPRHRLNCPSIVVASTDDPYGGIPIAQECAQAWGSRLVNLGPRGHINAASGLGDWDEGHLLLRSLQGAIASV